MKKYLKDPYYKDVVDVYGEDSLFSSGWFDDHNSLLDYKLTTQSSSFHKIKNELKKNIDKKPIVILLTTGGLAPMHTGHLNMFELSKIELEKKGFFVAGGFFSPSHDQYVLSKYEASIKMNVSERIQSCYDLTEETMWSVDTWEALDNKGSINFTDVYQRLFLSLTKKFGDLDFLLCYVFGSDNYDFHKPFCKKGLSVCVQRNSHIIDDPIQRNNFFYIKTVSNDISSKKIRQKEKQIFIHDNRPYLIREDVNITKEQKKQVYELFQEIFKRDIVFIPLIEQQKIVDQIKDPFLNFDKMTLGGIQIDISRVFYSNDNHKKPKNIIIKNFEYNKDEEYVIVDDDIATGTTIKLFKDNFPDIKIKGTLSLSQLWWENNFTEKFNPYDIVDLRDFVPNSSHYSGLLVDNNESLERVLYYYPSTNLVHRMKMEPKDVVYFTQKIKKIFP